MDGETTNGHSRLLVLQRTLMKDARRGLHSLVGDQFGIAILLPPRDDRAFPGAGPNLSLINDSHHTAASTTSIVLRGNTDYAGSLNASPRCSMAQHMRAFLAAMATTAFQ